MLRFHEVCGATDTWRLINQLLQRNIPGNMYHEAICTPGNMYHEATKSAKE